MKNFLLLLTLLLSAQAGATNYDIIYRFDSSVSNDYFTLKIDFDYVASNPVVFFEHEVLNYEQFVDVLLTGDNLPVFFFQSQLIDTNMALQLGNAGFGSTSMAGNSGSLTTLLDISGSAFFVSPAQPVDVLNFPSGWQPGHTLVDAFSPDQVTFVLTEITQVPLPAALPLFGLSLSILARRKRA
ncbi:MAG: hypothetical protein AB8G18_09630 [Gammaproteobacteria bacterium]